MLEFDGRQATPAFNFPIEVGKTRDSDEAKPDYSILRLAVD